MLDPYPLWLCKPPEGAFYDVHEALRMKLAHLDMSQMC